MNLNKLLNESESFLSLLKFLLYLINDLYFAKLQEAIKVGLVFYCPNTKVQHELKPVVINYFRKFAVSMLLTQTFVHNVIVLTNFVKYYDSNAVHNKYMCHLKML